LEICSFLGTIILFLKCALIDPGILTKDPFGSIENGLGTWELI